MFTGIITNLGKLAKNDQSTFTFDADQAFCKKIDIGTSVAVNGVCLTIIQKGNRSFSVELMPETLEKTMLGQLKINDLVNLELPATPTSFLSGHIVQGHVDGTAKLVDIKSRGNSRLLKFSPPSTFTKYIVAKGSIAINGISLTVVDTRDDHFTVSIIPYTWNHTMLKNLKRDELVNIEVDILAKYLERLQQ